MGQAIPVRADYTVGEVRQFAKRAKDAAQARRLLAIAATIVADDGVSTRTVLATRDMTSECCRAAALDRTHHLHLVEADMPRVSQTPSGAVVAEDVRNLQ